MVNSYLSIARNFILAEKSRLRSSPLPQAAKRYQKAVKNRNMKIIFLTFLTLQIFVCRGQKSETQIQFDLEILNSESKKSRDSLHSLIGSLNEKTKTTIEPNILEKLTLQADTLWNLADRIEIQELKRNLDFAKKHPYSLYAFKLVQQQISRQPGKNFYNDFEELYVNASQNVKESDAGKRMSEQLIFFKQSKVGSNAPAFQGKDVRDEHISLEGFRNKYVLIDFWASWCAPCKEEFPYLKELSTKYGKDKFEIISISIDENLNNWKKTIEKDKINNWIHYSLVENNSTVKQDYFVNGIPHKVLIDKNGLIIGKWKGGGELNKKELQEQLLKIFGY
ncbi:TlpA family protein disulfide reductase [Flavobacterium sp. PL11]|uniref:TlpA family protein disulfide reductase n=1 Tax=Flavobacterium sp. PL11 TaxID=3071717 RepID=UPI002E1139CA